MIRSTPRFGRLVTRLAILFPALLAAVPVWSQNAPPSGMRAPELRIHAITNAKVVVAPGQVIEKAVILIRDGVIEAVGPDVRIPREARIWNGEGKTVYPGLIDAAVLVDLSAFEKTAGSHWNRLITPELRAAAMSTPDDGLRKSLRDLGFTTAAVYPARGVLRGSGVIASTAGSQGDVTIYQPRAAMAVGLERTSGYPGSLMGAIALLRQTLYDARWHGQAREVWTKHPDRNEPPLRADSLAALDEVVNQRQPVLFHVEDELNLLRAARIMEEFALEGMFLGNGLEFRRLREVVAVGRPIIVPITFPERPDVTTLNAADNMPLSTMLTWEQAPTNPRRLLEAGATIALTTQGLSSRAQFFEQIQRAFANGLTEEQALEALTITPAKLLGLDHLMGTIEPGKLANLVVVEGTLFDRRPKIRDTWVEGRRFEISSDPRLAFTGSAALRADLGAGRIVEATARIDTTRATVSITPAPVADAKPEAVAARRAEFEGNRLLFLIDGTALGVPGYVQATSTYSNQSFTGTLVLPDGSRAPFTMTPIDERTPDADVPAEADDEAPPVRERDPLSGTWRTLVEGPIAPMPIPVTFVLHLDDDGTVSGELDTEYFKTPIENATYDRQAGQFSARVTTQMGVMSISAKAQADSMTGTVRVGEQTMMLAGERDAEVKTDVADARPTPRGAGAASGAMGARGARGGASAAGGGGSSTPEEGRAPDQLVYPLGAYGISEPPKQESVLVRGATIWTSGPQGVIENGDLFIEEGTIAYVGPAREWAPAPSARVIDASGRHITPGMIDAHSHTGVSGGLNEMGQNNTAEVRVSDVVNPDDINWYRQLAGGLTAVNQLHGSANPIGGQNAVVKIKWGGWVDDFRMDDAIAGIKFALGENVKRSQNRYPNTRMGVETVMRDAFIAAREYQETHARYEALSARERAMTLPPRRDLELDTLVEILEGKRLVHCHSYRQDEILMLLRLAEEFGFTVGTLQHILEGYKVAEVIASHGAGASSFSDWWAYKVEVMDAIPYNGAIMHNLGVNVSFNSDSDELARRMNTEAAKAVRYGGVTPEEALKFVTLNPAKQLRIDHRVGSLEIGKDADFVIWSGDPLSTYSRCEQTWIDGACYFSLERDAELRAAVLAERQRLIQKILTLAHGAARPAPEEPKAEEKEEDAQPEASYPFTFRANLPF